MNNYGSFILFTFFFRSCFIELFLVGRNLVDQIFFSHLLFLSRYYSVLKKLAVVLDYVMLYLDFDLILIFSYFPFHTFLIRR